MGLMKTAATVAVASAVHGRIQRRQQARWATQGQADMAAAPVPAPQATAAPDPAPTSAQSIGTSDRLGQLKQLGELLSAGVLTQAEFDQQKARILNS